MCTLLGEPSSLCSMFLEIRLNREATTFCSSSPGKVCPLPALGGLEGGKAGAGLAERPGEKEGADKWMAKLWGKVGSMGLL